MMEMAFTKILLKEPEAAGEELKKGIAAYAQSKIGRTVKDMTNRLPPFMRGPAHRAIMLVVNKQAEEYAGEAGDFDASTVMLEGFTSLLRGVVPGVIKRLSEHLAFTPAKGVLGKALEKVVKKILGIMQRGPWDDDSKVEIVDTIIESARNLIDSIRSAMEQADEKQRLQLQHLLEA
jgi:hypothetical protein